MNTTPHIDVSFDSDSGWAAYVTSGGYSRIASTMTLAIFTRRGAIRRCQRKWDRLVGYHDPLPVIIHKPWFER